MRKYVENNREEEEAPSSLQLAVWCERQLNKYSLVNAVRGLFRAIYVSGPGLTKE